MPPVHHNASTYASSPASSAIWATWHCTVLSACSHNQCNQDSDPLLSALWLLAICVFLQMLSRRGVGMASGMAQLTLAIAPLAMCTALPGGCLIRSKWCCQDHHMTGVVRITT